MSWRWLLDARPTIIKIIKDHHTYVIVRRPNVLDGPTMTLVMMTLFSRRGGVSLGYRKGAHSLPKQAVVKTPMLPSLPNAACKTVLHRYPFSVASRLVWRD